MAVFTEQELEVIQLVVNGMTNKEIAKEIDRSVEAVKSRLKKAYNISGMSTRTELVGFALRNGHAKL